MLELLATELLSLFQPAQTRTVEAVRALLIHSFTQAVTVVMLMCEIVLE